MDEPVEDNLSDARLAFARRDWRVAFDLLRAAEQRSPLDPADLELLADAAQRALEYDTFLDMLERAESRYERAGARGDAARVGLLLCTELFKQNRQAEAGGWLGRSVRLLEGIPECSAHGHLQWTLGRAAWATENFDTALTCARDATAIGRRLGDVDLEALGLHDEGHVLLARGEVDAGRALIDEAAALAAGATPNTAGTVYCGAIFAYRNMADWRRAAEWTDASLRWCERQSLSSFPGLCRFHRAEVRRLRGQLAEAEQDALDAVEELLPVNRRAASWGLAELGEIRRRRGDHVGARQAFRRSHELGGKGARAHRSVCSSSVVDQIPDVSRRTRLTTAGVRFTACVLTARPSRPLP
jgi:tetratricopeptide (TPR) repeat protein